MPELREIILLEGGGLPRKRTAPISVQQQQEAYRPPDVTVGEATRETERQIIAEFEKAPVVPYTPHRVPDIPTKRVPTQYYRKLTPEQEKRVIRLAEKLPPEKRAKYIVEPKLEPTWRETTVTGQILEGGLTGFFAGLLAPLLPEEKRKGYLEAMGTVGKFVEPKYGPIIFKKPTIAGFVGVVETWVRPEVPTPIGAGVGYVLGKPEQLKEYEELPPEYFIGGLLGTYAEAKAIGFVVGKAWAGIKRVTPKIIKQPITRAVKFGRVAKVAHKTRLWYVRHKPWVSKAKYGAKTEVAIPPAIEPISLKQLKAAEMAWRLTVAKRAGGVWVTRAGFAPAKTKVLPHLISRVGKVSIGYLRELPVEVPYWQRGLLPFVTQKQVTRLGIVPYIPKAVTVTGKRVVGRGMMGLGLVTIAKLPLISKRKRKVIPPTRLITTPKVWQPTLAYEREKFRPLTVLEPKVKQRERLVPMPKLPQALVQPQIPRTKVTPKLVQRQRQWQALVPKIPTPQVMKYDRTWFYPRKGITPSMRGIGLPPAWGRWWFRKHPIPTPKMVLETLVIGKRRRKKRKRRR